MIQIRPSQLSDLDRLMEIFDHARKFMASVGNGNQWINGYPQRELIAKEITDGHCYACEDEHGKIVGTFCFVPSPDPFYAIIEDGAWLNDDPYYVIHRIASDGSYKGIGDICLDWCAKQYPSYVQIRIKTILSCKTSLCATDSSAAGRFTSQMGHPELHTKKYPDSLRNFSANRKIENDFFYLCLRLEISHFK